MVRLEYGLLLFGAAMTVETYTGESYRPASIAILQFQVGGLELGYILGAAGLVGGVALLLMRLAGGSRSRGPNR